MIVFYYINQLQFSIVRRTALSYDLLYFCLPAACFTEVCVIVIVKIFVNIQQVLINVNGCTFLEEGSQ